VNRADKIAIANARDYFDRLITEFETKTEALEEAEAKIEELEAKVKELEVWFAEYQEP
jgi:BMFP domain-containing protein YqiC